MSDDATIVQEAPTPSPSATQELARAASTIPGELTVDEVLEQINKIQAVMARAMKAGLHYGVIPGTKKPTLLQPGAQKLTLLFQLAPRYNVEREDHPAGHRTYKVSCELHHWGRGFCGEGVGLASTLETKYRWRKKVRTCPACGVEGIIKGREEYGGGWLCWKKKGGCGAAFDAGDKSIEGQELGRVENPDIADCYNTVLKMGKKRALVDATLQVTAASDIFTQDVVELASEVETPAPQPPQQSWWRGDDEAFAVVKEIGDLAKQHDRVVQARDFLHEQARQHGDRAVLLDCLLAYRQALVDGADLRPEPNGGMPNGGMPNDHEIPF